MPRKKTPQKVDDIAEAAIACFTDMGIRRTQMADVAKVAGVSAGTLYLYVTSKEALFHLAILKVCARPLDGLALPLADPGMKATAAVFAARVSEVRNWPALDNALKPRARAGAETLHQIGLELFDMLYEARRAIWLVDRCSPEIAEFEQMHAIDLRARHRDQLATVALKAAGRKGAPSPGLRLAARLGIEIIAWASMHRLRESATNGIGGLSEENARETAARSFAATLSEAAGNQHRNG